MIGADEMKEMLQKGMAKKPANVWPVFSTEKSLDRTAFVSSSEIGYCERKVFFDKKLMLASGYSPEQGTTQVERGWGMMERGHNVEAWFIDTIGRVVQHYAPLLYAGAYQRSFVHGNQSGTPDGVFILSEERFQTIEVKSFDPRTNVTRLPKREHISQITQNCDILETCLDRTCVGTMLVYIDASDYERIFPFFLPFDHELAAKLEARAERIVKATAASELEPEGVHLGHCGYCRHATECNALVRKPMKEDMRNVINETAGRLFGKPQTRA